MMASPLTKVPSAAAALDWATKTGMQAATGADLLSPDVFSALVAYFGDEAIAGSSVGAIPREKELAADDAAKIKNSVNFLLGDGINAQLLIDMASGGVSPPGGDAGVDAVFPLQGEAVDLMAITPLLPLAISSALSKREALDVIQSSAPQIGGDIAPTSEITLEMFLTNLNELISDLHPKDELGGPLNIADLLSARDGQDAVLGTKGSEKDAALSLALPSAPQSDEGTLASGLHLSDKKLTLTESLLSARSGQDAVFVVKRPKQGSVLTQAVPSAPQPSEGTQTSVLHLGDKKVPLTDSLLSGRSGQDPVLGVNRPEQGSVLTQAVPSAPQPGEDTQTSALHLGDKKMTPTDNKMSVEITPKDVGTFGKLSMADLPVVPARTVASIGSIPLPEKAVSQTIDPTSLSDSGLQATASNALLNTGPEVQIGLGKKQSAFAGLPATATPQAATPPSIPNQPVMSDSVPHVAASPDRVAPPVFNASALETAAAIAGVDTAPGGTGGQSQGGNSQTGPGTNSQQGMAQSQALAAVLDVQRQGWTKALVNRAMSLVQSGGTMTFKIMPAHLGQITLKLSEGRRGTDLRIVADVAATASMLRDVKHQISSAFESAGIILGEYSAGTSDRREKGSTSQNRDEAEGGAEATIKLNQDVAKLSDYSGDDRSNINIIL
jgi:hypothetical protein